MKPIHFKILKEDVEVGLSKIGGKPDLRTNIEYPVNENGFYGFIAQINFEELNFKSELLPQKGILSLFVGSISQNEYQYFYFSEIPEVWRIVPLEISKILNEQLELQGIEEQMYLVHADNDCGGVFLTKEQHAFIADFVEDKWYKPYKPIEWKEIFCKPCDWKTYN